MAMKFKIDHVLKELGSICVEQLDKGVDFWLTENTRLGTIEIKREMSMPRALDDNGTPRLDLFIFSPKHENDIDKFHTEEIYELVPGNELEILEPWETIDSNSNYYENELRKEISAHHILSNVDLAAIAKKNDDIIFKFINENKFAVVHLTWSGKRESSINFPITEIFDHWTELYDNRIVKDYLGWL